MNRYIIGEEVDKRFSMDMMPPVHLQATSELCRKNDEYVINLKAPYLNDGVTEKTFVVHLYASNSRSNPYDSHKNNYWSNLVPTWKFYSEDGKTIISDLPITVKNPNSLGIMTGSAKFHYVDDMPSTVDTPIYLWATLDTEKIIKVKKEYLEEHFEEDSDDKNVVFPGTTFTNEIVTYNNVSYQPPSYSNSRLITVCAVHINPLQPTKLSITRNGKELVQDGIYWSNQVIPFIATVNSDHYNKFRYKDKLGTIDDFVDLTSDIVYDFPMNENISVALSGELFFSYDEEPRKYDRKNLIEKYKYIVDNYWEKDQLSGYHPDIHIVETSAYPADSGKYLPDPNTIEIMDYPTYNDLTEQYPDINLDDYFEHRCVSDDCEEQDPPQPDENILTLEEYARLIKEHEEFEYIPYALRVIDTLSYSPSGDLTFEYSTISSMDSSANPVFKLIDDSNEYGYKIGGYTFGKVICPYLYGEDRDARFTASAYFDNTEYPDNDFHIFKYWVIADGKGIIAADDRNNLDIDESMVTGFIGDKNVYRQTTRDEAATDMNKTEDDRRYTIYGDSIGATCVVQDPQYNVWICDADTHYIYKYGIDNKKILEIDIEDRLNAFVNTYVHNEDLKTYWNNAVSAGLSPSHMAVNSNNELFITFFDSMMFVRMDGRGGDINNAYIFPDYDRYVAGLPEDCSWRPVGIDINEKDDVIILFNTINEDDPDKKTPVYDISTMSKMVYFDNGRFSDSIMFGNVEYRDEEAEEEIQNDSDKITDTNNIVFRSTETMDYIFVSGTHRYKNSEDLEKEETVLVRYEVPRPEEGKPRDLTNVKGTILFYDKNPHEENEHVDIDNLYMDADDNLWFSMNIDHTQQSGSKILSTLYCVRNAKKDLENVEVQEITIQGKEGDIEISGISQTNDFNLVLLMSDGKYKIKSYVIDDRKNPSSISPYVYKHRQPPAEKEIDLSNIPLDSNNPFDGRLLARGDWTGIDWINKYDRFLKITLVTDKDEETLKLQAYENKYLRKHHEEWDVAEHAKIPVINTDFPENNPTLFKMIGETLGVDEHKHYSIGKKLYEGIANQVANIHDIDECHIDSIYEISRKEDVMIDKFILSYPEELRRMVDLASITRKKLWGDRCKCTQNYFKTKDRHNRRYCEKCNHIHESNLGKIIDPMDCGIWSLVNYLLDRKLPSDENTWYSLIDIIKDQIRVVNDVLDLEDPVVISDNPKNIYEVISAYNKTLYAVEKYIRQPIKQLTKKSNSYDAVHTIVLMDHILQSLPNAYIIEDKYNRNDFMRITISEKSYIEAKETLKAIKNNTYLDEHDEELLEKGETNERIILVMSVLGIEDDARDVCYKNSGEVNPGEEIDELEMEKWWQSQKETDPSLDVRIECAQTLAIHTSFFSPDHWFNYCYWHLAVTPCYDLNTSVINWDSKYTTMDEYDWDAREKWYDDNGTMVKLINYILHNGMLFDKNQEYIYD